MDLNIILGIIGPNQLLFHLVIVVLLLVAKKIPGINEGSWKRH